MTSIINRWALPLVFLLLLYFAWPISESSSPDQLQIGKESTIVFFGNSLIEGKGAQPTESVPAIVQKSLSIPVINSGFSGITSAEALSKIDQAVLKHHPVIVVIELGANDYLQNRENFQIDSLKKNLSQLIERIEGENRLLYLTKFYNDQVASSILGEGEEHSQMDQLFLELQQRYSLRLIEDIWSGIWGDSTLMSDALHPNGKGYQLMADHYLQALMPVLQKNNLLKPAEG